MITDGNLDSNSIVRDYNYSRVLDVHIWSNYPEVNDFVSKIYEAYFSKQCFSPLKLCQYILAKGVRKHDSEALY